MLMLDCAGKQDIPFLKQIWKECFGDSDRYITRYFDTLFDRITIAVRRSGGIPVSMVSMLPVSLCTPDGNYPGHYIYAAATAKAFEGKGYMSELLDYACNFAAERGDCFSCLIPATPSLFTFYQRREYRTASYKNMKFISLSSRLLLADSESAGLLTDLEEDAFFARRRSFLKKQDASVVFGEQYFPYLYLEMQNAGVFVTGVGETDYAVCYPDRGLLTVKETSLSEQALTECLPALLKRFHCAEAVAIFPTTEDSFSHNIKPHGMIRPLSSFPISLKTVHPYMGLMMD